MQITRTSLSSWRTQIARIFARVVSVGLIGWGMYLFRQRLIRRWFGLSPVRFATGVERGIRIPLPDGVELVADHYFPKTAGSYPTILIRTPYHRLVGAALFWVGPRFAERGYHVIVQDVRGRFESTGLFEPFVNEVADGCATLDWITRQAWFNGVLGMWGQSYLGYVQWAIATQTPQPLKAIVPIITASQFVSVIRPEGAFALDTMLRWTYLVDTIDIVRKRSLPQAIMRMLRQEQVIGPALQHVPIIAAEQVATGEPQPFYQDWLTQPRTNGAYWQMMDHSKHLARVAAAPHLIGGWYDIFLRDQLADYAALREAGQTPYLTIGPWAHLDFSIIRHALREGLAWFDAHLQGQTNRLRTHPVQVYVMGANEWRTLEQWPPAAQETRYFLHAAGQLALMTPADWTPPDTYRYNPADPTPAVGGPLMNRWGGPRDNRALEARPDVLCYTTAPLAFNLEVIGPVRLELYVRSSLDHTDFCGRLCDVYPDGRSINICDGLFRVEPGAGECQPDGTLRIEIDMWATAHRFRWGHRIRLQVSSGAHPRWSRNFGTREPIGTARRMVVAAQSIYHDQAHPSALVLPVCKTTAH